MPNSDPNQNGKNPGWGCPTDHPDPTDLACTTIAIANAMNHDGKRKRNESQRREDLRASHWRP